MSTLKTYNIQHPSSLSVNVGLGSDGSTSIGNRLVIGSGGLNAGIITTTGLNAGIITTTGLNAGIITTTGLSGVAYAGVTTTSISKTLSNRELCTIVPVGIGTTAGITVTLPASPSAGWEVGVAIAGTFTDTVISRNGSRIMGLAENLTLNIAYSTVRFVYTDTNGGWRIF